MVKKAIILLVLFFALFRVVSVISSHIPEEEILISPASEGSSSNLDLSPKAKEPLVFASLPTFSDDVKTSVKTADARAEIIRQYLKSYESPLEPYAELIVELSDTYNFDYRWMVAIAQQESSLCKYIPENSYNCWGWGIYPEPTDPTKMKITRFDSYEDALRRIAPQFTKIFLQGKHMKDPMEVMRTYTPPSDGSWANGVNQFFGNLE